MDGDVVEPSGAYMTVPWFVDGRWAISLLKNSAFVLRLNTSYILVWY